MSVREIMGENISTYTLASTFDPALFEDLLDSTGEGKTSDASQTTEEEKALLEDLLSLTEKCEASDTSQRRDRGRALSGTGDLFHTEGKAQEETFVGESDDMKRENTDNISEDYRLKDDSEKAPEEKKVASNETNVTNEGRPRKTMRRTKTPAKYLQEGITREEYENVRRVMRNTQAKGYRAQRKQEYVDLQEECEALRLQSQAMRLLLKKAHDALRRNQLPIPFIE